jgi:hypothetical protein
MAVQPRASAFDQIWQRLAESLDGVADFLGVNVRRSVLQPPLEDVELVQQCCLGSGQSFVGGECLEDLLRVRATVGEQADRRDPALALRIST